MKYYFEIWKKFGDFHSRATRDEFSYFILIHAAIIAFLFALGYAVEHPFADKVIDTVSGLFIVGSMLSCAALFVRRLNALGRDRRLLFAALIPVVGILYLVIICMKDETTKKSAKLLNLKTLFQKFPGRQRA